MGNYQIVAFKAFDFTQTGIYSKGGSVDSKEARGFELLYPPYNPPISPYGEEDLPYEYPVIQQDFLLVGTPAANATLMETMQGNVLTFGTLQGRAGATNKYCDAYFLKITGNWEAPFMAGVQQWLHITCRWQPLTDWESA